MKMTRIWLLWLLSVLLVGCSSPFAPVVLAPNDAINVATPQKLPEMLRIELQGKKMFWENLVQVDTGKVIEHPVRMTRYAFSEDGVYMVYNRSGAIGHDRTEMRNLETGVTKIVLEQSEFPDSTFFGGLSISPDNQKVLVAVFWSNSGGLVEIDIATQTWQHLKTNVVFGGFGESDISPDGKILVRCASRNGNQPVVELCLLDEKGNLIRYLTRENYLTISGMFTPDGEWVVYQSRYKLYRVRVDGSDREEIAPCGGGVLLVTEHYVLTTCVISQEPECIGYFVSELEGKDLWRLDYLEPYCWE